MSLYRKRETYRYERDAMLRSRLQPYRSVTPAAAAASRGVGVDPGIWYRHHAEAAVQARAQAEYRRISLAAMLRARAAPGSRAKATLPAVVTNGLRLSQYRGLYPIPDREFARERAAMFRARLRLPRGITAAATPVAAPFLSTRQRQIQLVYAVRDERFDIERRSMLLARRPQLTVDSSAATAGWFFNFSALRYTLAAAREDEHRRDEAWELALQRLKIQRARAAPAGAAAVAPSIVWLIATPTIRLRIAGDVRVAPSLTGDTIVEPRLQATPLTRKA